MEAVRAHRISDELYGNTVGGWRVDGYVGHGGSAVVLRAVKEGLTVALKLIDPDLVEQFGRNQQVARVMRERMLIGHQEKHLVRIYDAGVCLKTDYLFIAMELLDTPNLTDFISEFPREKIVPVVKQIATAARFLEGRNFAHRDIKPDNVSISNDIEMAKLLDLGVIRPVINVDGDIGTGNAFLGTTRYSSPEYLMREGDEDSEEGWRALTFYQLGALLHDMIMRRRMFDEIDGPPARLTDAVRYKTPTIDCSDVHPRIVGLAKSCLQKDWRLRLKLVDWTDFSDSPKRIDASVARNRIASRIVMQRNAVTEPQPKSPARSYRNILKSISAQIATVLQRCCTESELFPPVRIDEVLDQSSIRLLLRTEPSRQHALSEALMVGFIVRILDRDGIYVSVSGLAALGNLTINEDTQALREIFSGEISSPELRSRLQSYLYLVLDAAQRQVVIADSNILVVKFT